MDKRSFTPIFDINKQFPKLLRDKNMIWVKFLNPYSVYLQYSIEYKFLLLEIEFLARFKRAMYDGRVAPLSEMKQLIVPEKLITCIYPQTNKFSLIDLNEGLEYFVEGGDLEYFTYRSINVRKFIEDNRPYIISEQRFAHEFLEYYKLDNIYNTKLMKIYNSAYFGGESSGGSERTNVASLVGELSFGSEQAEG